jgi:hypothetical protein
VAKQPSIEKNHVQTNPIASEISRYVSNPLQQGEVFFEFLVDQSKRQPYSLHHWVGGLEACFGWVVGDPSNQRALAASELLYEDKPLYESYDVPSEDRETCATLLDSLTIDDDKYAVFQIGARGSGKSSAQNRLINHRGDNLFKRRHTFFRADVSKLHEYNAESLAGVADHSARMTIPDYMALHAFFVALRKGSHESKDPAMVLFAKDAIEATKSKYHNGVSDTDFTIWLKTTAEAESGKFVNHWFNVITAFRRRDQHPHHNKDLFTFFRFCRDGNRIPANELQELFLLFLEYVTGRRQDNSCWREDDARDVVVIVDGVDNLRLDEFKLDAPPPGGLRSRSWYALYLNDLHRCVMEQTWAPLVKRMLVALRPDTAEDLRRLGVPVDHQEERLDDARFGGKALIHVSPPDVNALVRRKVNAAQTHPEDSMFLSGVPRAHVERRAEFETEVPEMHIWFEHFYQQFIKMHLESLTTCDVVAASASDVVRVVFNDNIRSFQRNLLRTFSALYTRTRLECDDESAPDRAARFNLFKALTASPFCIEASVTAGSPYFADNDNERIKGRWCPNVFDFVPTKSGTKRWYGLVNTRLLQLLPSSSDSRALLSEDEVLESLAIFDYPAVLIRRALLLALEFGLIEQGEFALNENGTRVARYRKTEKGEYVLRLPFKNAVVLYLMATGCRLDMRGFEVERSYQKRLEEHWLHSNTTKIRNFRAAALKSGAYLLRHIVSAHEYEKNWIGSARFKKEFELPDISPLVSDLTSAAIAAVQTATISSILRDFQLERADAT